MIIKSYEIQKNLEKFLKYNFFLLYGENEGIKKNIQEIIKNGLNKENTGIESLSVYENEILNNEEDFYNTIYSGSLFGDCKIITINNGTDKILNLIENILDKYPKNVFFIIFSEILEKKSKIRNLFEKGKNTLCVPCYLDSDRDLQNIARNEAKKLNINISSEIVNLLIEKANGDRLNIKKEIEKIKNLYFNKQSVEIDEIKSIINFAGEYKNDDFINECLCGNITQYKRMLSEFYSNTINQVFFLRVLSNKIQRLLNMKKVEKNYDNLDNLLSSSKPPIFWKEKPMIKKQLSLWGLDDLNNIMSEMHNIEILCKKNPQISKIIFYNFFTSLCKKANSFS
jgi:DNA polymerase III subunit delta